jgi:5'-3' exonuclease
MGIKGLKSFIRNKYSNIVNVLKLSFFSDEKISVDVSSFIYKYKVVFRDNWLKPFVSLICILKEYRVHGIFIFDGKPPIQKLKEQEKRKSQKHKLEESVEALQRDIDLYMEKGIISDLLRKIGKETSPKTLLLQQNDEIDINKVQEYLEKKRGQIVNISPKDIEDLKHLFTLFGVVYIQANGEAEALGSYLCNIGKTKAILSEDTDVLAYGTEYYLSDIDTSSGECTCIQLSDVLREMNLQQNEFLDFCILCGTDFNSNIPRIGIVGASNLIAEHRTINDDNIKNIKGFDIDYEVVRNIFKSFGNIDKNIIYKTTYWDTNIDLEKIQEVLRELHVDYLFNDIKKLWKPNVVIVE